MKFVFGALVFVAAAVLALAGGMAVAAGPSPQTTVAMNVTPTQSLCFPYVQTKSGVTTVYLVNPGGAPITCTVTAYDAAGHLAGTTAEASLAGYGSVQVAVDAPAGLGTGWHRAAVSDASVAVGVEVDGEGRVEEPGHGAPPFG